MSHLKILRRSMGCGFALTLAASACSSSNEPAATGSGGSSSTGGASNTGGGTAAPCGKEFQQCCETGVACETGQSLTCNDSACVRCDHVPSAASAGCTNVALGAKATSSVTSGGDPAVDGPALAVDGSACTYFNSGNYPSDSTIGLAQTVFSVDLGRSRTFGAMTLWLAMTPSGSVNLKVEYSADGTTWQPEFSGTRPMSGSEPWLYTFGGERTARYFRIVFLSGPSWVGIRELQLFECPVSDAGPG